MNTMFVKDHVKYVKVVITDGGYVGTTKRLSFEGEPSKENAKKIIKALKDFIIEEIDTWEYEFPVVNIIFKGDHFSFEDKKLHNDATLESYRFEL